MKFGKLAAGLALTTALGAFSAQAQEFKSTIRFIVPFGAGGATDVLARLVAPIVSKELGQTVIVENRAGANGQIGTQYVKSAPADGSVFLVTTEQPMVILPFITPNLGYVPARDFQMVGKMASLQWALTTPATTGAKTLQEFVDYIKVDPVRANYAVPAVGGVPEIIGQVVGKKANMPMTILPYAGGAPIIPHLLGGQISSGVTGAPEALSMQKTGKVQVLAISGTKRSPYLPTVPTFEELGFSGLTVDSWFGVFAPKALPRPMAERFNKALLLALADPEVQRKIAEMAIQITPRNVDGSATDFDAALSFWKNASASQATGKH